jgi:dolichol-phosphate mannosyltransferase
MNEGKNLKLLIPKILQEFNTLNIKNFELVLINDNSIDNTVEVIESWQKKSSKIRLSHQLKIPGGSVGEGIKEGIRISKGEYILLMDGDLSQDPKYFGGFFEKVERGFLLIMGGRYSKNQSPFRPLYRYFFSRILNIVIKSVLFSPLYDNSHGFRVFKRRAVDIKNLKSTDFGIYLELTKRLLHNIPHKLVTEIPIEYGERLYGKSKLTWNFYLKYLKVLFFY